MAKKRLAISSKEAKQGEKMIEVKIRLWTNNISQESGKVIPKHAWASGVVRIERNDTHGVKPSAPVPFHSLLDVGKAIESVLIKHGIVLQRSRQMRKYMSDE